MKNKNGHWKWIKDVYQDATSSKIIDFHYSFSQKLTRILYIKSFLIDLTGKILREGFRYSGITILFTFIKAQVDNEVCMHYFQGKLKIM